jgi:hypothetical protein
MLEPRTPPSTIAISSRNASERIVSASYGAPRPSYHGHPALLRFVDDRPGLSDLYEGFRDAAFRCYRVADPAVADFVEVERFGEKTFQKSPTEYSASFPCSLSLSPDSHWAWSTSAVSSWRWPGLGRLSRAGNLLRLSDPGKNVLIYKDAGVVRGIRIQKPGYISLLPGLSPDDEESVLEQLRLHGGRSESPAEGRTSDPTSTAWQFTWSGSCDRGPAASPGRGKGPGALGFPGITWPTPSPAGPCPAAVIRVALRALRRESRPPVFGLRGPTWRSCGRSWTTRRELFEERTQRSPGRRLEALNRGFARKRAAAEAVRSLDTADFSGPVGILPEPARPELVLGFPGARFLGPRGGEAHRVPGDRGGGGRRNAVHREASGAQPSDRFAESGSPQVVPPPERPSGAGEDPSADPPPLPRRTCGNSPGAPGSGGVDRLPARSRPRTMSRNCPPRKRGAPPAPWVDPSGVRWSHITVLPDEVVEERAEAFRRSLPRPRHLPIHPGAPGRNGGGPVRGALFPVSVRGLLCGRGAFGAQSARAAPYGE